MDFVFSASSMGNDSTGKEPPDGNDVGLKAKVSFKDMMMGKKESVPRRPRVDLFKENLAKIELEDNDRLKPKVHIADAVFDGLCVPWQDALVVKLLGKNIGYHVMKDRLTRIWKLMADFDILDIGNNFYMVKFDTEADRTKVMEEGPWMIFDRYLTVQKWSPEFISPTAKIDKTLVWVRFPGLNLVFYDESILMALATAIGTPVRVDTNTLGAKRGRFARLCVQIDLDKPVVGKVWLRGHWYKVEYEGLHRICATYGCYGHLARDCVKAESPINVALDSSNSPAVAGSMHHDAALVNINAVPTNQAVITDTIIDNC